MFDYLCEKHWVSVRLRKNYFSKDNNESKNTIFCTRRYGKMNGKREMEEQKEMEEQREMEGKRELEEKRKRDKEKKDRQPQNIETIPEIE